jgi:acetylornithine/succinyldiaminopimelate/putrescine aminotransferase
MKTFEQIAELERRYLLGTYNRYPVVLTRGKGVFLYDLEDRRYLDFVSGLGVNALGHVETLEAAGSDGAHLSKTTKGGAASVVALQKCASPIPAHYRTPTACLKSGLKT